MYVSSFYKPQILVTGCQKKHENIDFIDLQQGGIIYFKYVFWDPVQISVLAAITYMEKKRKHFQAVVVSTFTNTLIQPDAAKLEEALQNTDPHVCPAGVSYRGMAWTKAWPWRSLTCDILHQAKSWQVVHARYGVLGEMLVIPSP